MSKIIFLLGAGASRDAGLPLMAELTGGFPKWLESSAVEDKPRSKDLFDAAVKAVSPAGQNPNIESVLTLLAQVSALKLGPGAQIVTQWKAPFDGASHEPPELAADIREYIVAQLIKVNPKDGEYLYGLLDFRDSDEPLDVFTMNYDRLVESMAARFGVRLTTGFADAWDPGLFDVQNKWQLRVFKLHGSVDWYRLPGRAVIFQGAKEHYAFPGEPPLEVLLYPAEGKESYAEPYATLMASFTSALSEAEFCVVIGYSFRDAHIRRSVLDRLATNPSLQLLIVNPRAEEVLLLPRERPDEPAIQDFADRISGLWFGAKQALDDRLIADRLQEIRNADAALKRVLQDRSGRDFNSAAFDLIDAVERCRNTHLPSKPVRILRQIVGGEFQRSMRMALRATANVTGRAAGSGIDAAFPGIGERAPSMPRGGGEPQYFGALVSCWLLAKALLPAEDASKIVESISAVLLKMLKGLLILEDGRYVCWPDVLDPGIEAAQEVVARAAKVREFANELDEWPPWTGLELVDENTRREYAVLASGLIALAELYEVLSIAPPRRIRIEPDNSFIGVSSPAWRIMVLNPLANSPLGERFKKLEQSGLIGTWMNAPMLSGAPGELADL